MLRIGRVAGSLSLRLRTQTVGLRPPWFASVAALQAPLRVYPPHFLLSCCGLDAWPGRFRSDSGHKQSGCARLGLHPSLRSKLPCASILRTSCCHAADWTRGRVAFAPTPDANSRAASALVCIRRCAPSSPARLSSALLVVMLRIGRVAGSLSLRLRTQTVGLRPPWFVSVASLQAPLRVYPSRFLLSCCGLGAWPGRQLLRLRANPCRPMAVPGLCPSAPECASPMRLSFALLR